MVGTVTSGRVYMCIGIRQKGVHTQLHACMYLDVQIDPFKHEREVFPVL